MKPPPSTRADGVASVALVILAVAMLGLLAIPSRGLQFGWTLGLVGIATVAWIVVIQRIIGDRFAPGMGLSLALVIGLRAIVLPLAPALSDDVFRYVHEGRMVLAGENPFLIAPIDPATESHRGPEWARINHPEIPAAYPPAVQLANAAAVRIEPSPVGIKLAYGLFDVVTFLLLWRLCRSLGVTPARALVYGLCPLVALEFAGEGHGDSLAACAMVGGLLAARVGRVGLSGAVLAVATAAKWLPCVLLPYVARGRGVRPWVAFAAVFLSLWWMFVPFDEPARVLRGTLEYTARWRHNDTLFALVNLAARWAHAAGWTGSLDAQRAARLPLAVLGGALLVGLWRRRVETETAAFWFFAFFLAFAPTVHPWYVAGLFVPWLVLRPNPWLLLFCGTILIADHPVPGWLRDGVWRENGWLKLATWAPFYLGVALEGLRARRVSD